VANLEQKRMGVPCPYMVYDSKGYHGCAILSAINDSKFPDSTGDTVCAWFYDICDDGIKTITPKEVVPKICPRRYTFEEIDAKIQPLMRKFLREKQSHGDKKLHGR